MKQTGLTYWDNPNTDATNLSKFNGRGSGWRVDGVFTNIKTSGLYYTTDIYPGYPDWGLIWQLSSSLSFFYQYPGGNKKWGASLRLVKESTDLSNGQEGIYVGNDGKVYRTICIGTQEWLADNLSETRYRNGDLIPNVTDSSTWSGLTTGARCFYDNNESNAYSI